MAIGDAEVEGCARRLLRSQAREPAKAWKMFKDLAIRASSLNHGRPACEPGRAAARLTDDERASLSAADAELIPIDAGGYLEIMGSRPCAR